MTDNGANADETPTSAGVTTDTNDWRVTVRLHAGHQAGQALEHLSTHQVEDDVKARLGRRVMVGADGGNDLFVYAHSRDGAAAAQQSVSDLLTSHGIAADYSVDRWHPVAEEWEPADVPLPSTPAEVHAEHERLDAEETSESEAAGVALFEVRVQLPSHREAVELAAKLAGEGYSVVRRWRFLVVGANNEDQVAEFAAAIRGEAPAGAKISTEEVGPDRPYTVFEVLAGEGL